MRPSPALLTLILACTGDKEAAPSDDSGPGPGDSGQETGTPGDSEPDTGESAHTGEPGDSGESGHSGETGAPPEPLAIGDLPAGALVITEILIDPADCPDSEAEYIELYNAAGAEVDLFGLVITDSAGNSGALADHVIVAADAYAVGTKYTDETRCYAFTGDFVYERMVAMDNTGDSLSVGTATTALDEVDFSGWDVPVGASLSLAPEAMDASANDAEEAWCAASTTLGTTDAGTPGAANDACAPDTGGGALEGDFSLGDADAVLVGEAADDQVGAVRAISGAGDLNGDGLGDLLIGAYQYDGPSDGGAAYVVYAPFSGSASLASHEARLVGAAFDYAGRELDAGRDLDGDGVSELFIGGYHADVGLTDAGAGFLLYGPVSGDTTLVAAADQIVTGANAIDYAGTSVAMSDDVTGDGEPDLLVGAYMNDDAGTMAGAAYVAERASGTASLSGAAATLLGDAAGDSAGWSLDRAGDVNGDGVADVVVGAFGAEASYVALGPLAGSMSLGDADQIVLADGTSDYMGLCVSDGGDVDADGYADVLLGAPYADDGGWNSGNVYLVAGSSAPVASMAGASAEAKLVGEYGSSSSFGDEAGISLAAAGDVDADGQGDILIGAEGQIYDGSFPGGAYLVYGPISGTSSLAAADARFHGTVAGMNAGSGVGAAGDLNGDGYADLGIGALYDGTGGTNAGAVYLFMGAAR